jgi:hypothetical protein
MKPSKSVQAISVARVRGEKSRTELIPYCDFDSALYRKLEAKWHFSTGAPGDRSSLLGWK